MQSGQRIRDYLLEEKIGEGGMGEVWRALHTVLQREVAIKVMSRQIAADPHFGERFLQEARAQAALQHSRILGVTDFFSEGNVHYLVMPLVTGQSLEERMKAANGPLPMDEALSIARDVLDALDYAHQRGIIHRDVKPSNILLDKSGYAYLTDFGIALLVGQQRMTRTGSLLGTREYMSPEQVRNPRGLDHRTDVYSAGCLIYEMLAGRPPFLAEEDDDASTDFAVMEAHVYQQPESIRKWNPAIPAGLDAVVLRALAKKPDERFGGCGEFRRALENWDRYQPPAEAAAAAPPPLPKSSGANRQLPPPPPPVQLASSPPKKSGRTALYVLIGLILLVIVGVLIASSKKEEPEETAVEETTSFDMGTEMTTEMTTEAPVMGTDMSMGTEAVPEETPSATPVAYTPTPPPPSNPSQTRYSQEVIRQLDAGTGTAGVEKDKEYYLNVLEKGQTNTVDFTLDQGVTYLLTTVCDTDCTDVDITLLDENGNQLGVDEETDDHPSIVYTPQQTGRFLLKIDMVSCSTTNCVYGVGIFRMR
jgi:serine/threonine-protein kinase